jgi:ubiquinone/menaquinone biosynthesis C-methylase UbiE
MHKFESPARLAELKPNDTLRNIGLKLGDVFCDIGAGTGIFTIPAVNIARSAVYAVDTSESMLAIIGRKCSEQGVDNVTRINPNGYSYPIADGECDIVFMCTVFHEIDDTAALLGEISRIMGPHGKLVIIEFYEKTTPMGPPVTSRIGETKLKRIARKNGFARTNQTSLGENFYLSEFEKNI